VLAGDGPLVSPVSRACSDSSAGRTGLGVLSDGPDLSLESSEVETDESSLCDDGELVEVVVGDDDDVVRGVGVERVDKGVNGELGETGDTKDSVGEPKSGRAAWSVETKGRGQGGSRTGCTGACRTDLRGTSQEGCLVWEGEPQVSRGFVGFPKMGLTGRASV
jgi:hypothetical protein